MSEDRLAALEAKVAFIFHVIALTKTHPDGTRVTQPLGAVFQEAQTHADTATPPPATVALPHTGDPLPSGPGPDGTP
jgi:hypothetical protein